MSDKELEEYINKIEPNFNSHLEKGTIEMSHEYYNLLEEKMAELINENQKLVNQQKEFMNWLEEQIKDMGEEIGNSITKPYKEGHIIRRNVYQEILSKHKETIGVKDEANKQ